MNEPMPWTERTFIFDQPLGVFPAIVERLRGTPARAAELVAGVPEDVLRNRVHEKWSVKEHVGHLVDLEAMDEKRLREFQNHVTVLSPADIGNRTSEEGKHRETPIDEIVTRMRIGRIALVQQLEELTNDEIAILAVHPRLRMPMRLLDWAYFVAEHDDHHLAWVTRIIRELEGTSTRNNSRAKEVPGSWLRPIHMEL
jgi:uncharacterized damage-inducible protein DinB